MTTWEADREHYWQWLDSLDDDGRDNERHTLTHEAHTLDRSDDEIADRLSWLDGWRQER